MIGIKVKQQIWQIALLDLLSKEAEVWSPNKNYKIIITDDPKANFTNQVRLDIDITLPCTFEELKKLIGQQPTKGFENDTFLLQPEKRQLINKKTQQTIQLTERESELIVFLVSQPNQKATRETLLKEVWRYNNDAQTHTLESHIYTLRQKLGSNADQLICTKEGYYFLN